MCIFHLIGTWSSHRWHACAMHAIHNENIFFFNHFRSDKCSGLFYLAFGMFVDWNCVFFFIDSIWRQKHSLIWITLMTSYKFINFFLMAATWVINTFKKMTLDLQPQGPQTLLLKFLKRNLTLMEKKRLKNGKKTQIQVKVIWKHRLTVMTLSLFLFVTVRREKR